MWLWFYIHRAFIKLILRNEFCCKIQNGPKTASATKLCPILSVFILPYIMMAHQPSHSQVCFFKTIYRHLFLLQMVGFSKGLPGLTGARITI